MANQKHNCTKTGTSDIWEIETNEKGALKNATLNGIKMASKLKEGQHGTTAVDFNKMQGDFDACHPSPPRSPNDKPVDATYLYSIPLRDAHNNIIWWTCGGAGSTPCGG